jgi:hypothetical protein
MEAWQCKMYRQKGKEGCRTPQIRSFELDLILSKVFEELMKDQEKLIDSLITVITHVPKDVDYEKIRSRIQQEIQGIHAKKDRLLDLSIAGALTTEEFKHRNDAWNVQICNYEIQLAAVKEEEEKQATGSLDVAEIRQVLEKELRFDGEINNALVASILKNVVVKKESTRQEIHLDIYLKLGQQYEAVYTPEKRSASIIRLKNTTPSPPTRRI